MPSAFDFFQDPSREIDLIDALFTKQNEQVAQGDSFTLAGEAGVLATSGNTETSMIKVALDATQETEHWSNRYATQFLERNNSFEEGSNIATTRFEISGQFDYKLNNPDHRLFAYAEYDDNKFNLLRDQATVVIGYSEVLLKEEALQFRYSIGPGFSTLLQERNNNRISEGILRGTMLFDYEFSTGSRFQQFVSAEVGQELAKARSQTSFTAKVINNLAMKLSFELVLDDNVAQEDESISTQTSVSIVYNFF